MAEHQFLGIVFWRADFPPTAITFVDRDILPSGASGTRNRPDAPSLVV